MAELLLDWLFDAEEADVQTGQLLQDAQGQV